MTNAPASHSLPSDGSTRGSSRALLSVVCDVRQGTRPWQRVVLEDLSASGFCIAGLSQPNPNAALSIRIPGMQLLTARLRWQERALIGCEFTAPLHVAVFEHLVRQSRGIPL